MNYLAHAYLSFGKPGILVGNMISDFVKGKKKFDYPLEIQQGMELHRAIDQFTDKHKATGIVKEIFRPDYRLYCGALADVVYDYYLANDLSLFTEVSLYEFSQEVYNTLDVYKSFFPEPFIIMYPYMKEQNWLFNYRLPTGMKKSFGGLVRRAAYISESETAFRLFEENMHAIKNCYSDLFPELREFARQQLQIIHARE